MLRLVSVGSSLPHSFICDYSAEFQPGMLAQLTVLGNQVIATVSNGTAPIGIIDDIKTRSFTAPSWDESVIVPATGIPGPNNTIITAYDIKKELNNPIVVASSFTSTVPVQLIPRNGVVVFPAGTQLNFDETGSGTPNAIKSIVRYTYQIPNIIGEDSTQGSNRITVWYQRMILQTDQYETNQIYPLNANLFVSETGLFTTRQPAPNYPAVGIVTAPPSSLLAFLELLFL